MFHLFVCGIVSYNDKVKLNYSELYIDDFNNDY